MCYTLCEQYVQCHAPFVIMHCTHIVRSSTALMVNELVPKPSIAKRPNH